MPERRLGGAYLDAHSPLRVVPDDLAWACLRDGEAQRWVAIFGIAVGAFEDGLGAS